LTSSSSMAVSSGRSSRRRRVRSSNSFMLTHTHEPADS
jgi:hypothetical protein